MQAAGIVYNDLREEKQKRYQKAVERASFLNKREKENWALMGYLLSTEELESAEKYLIDRDLRQLLTKEKLAHLKSNHS